MVFRANVPDAATLRCRVTPNRTSRENPWVSIWLGATSKNLRT
jgi:hypothetical protein